MQVEFREGNEEIKEASLSALLLAAYEDGQKQLAGEKPAQKLVGNFIQFPAALCHR